MSVQSEIERLTGVKQKNREDGQTYLVRVVKALDDLSDKQYNKLSKAAQDWAEEATQLHNNTDDELPDFPDEEEADEDDTEDEAEEDAEPEDESDEEPAEDDDEETEDPETDEDQTEDEDMPATQEAEDETPRRRTAAKASTKKAKPGNTSKPAQKANHKAASSGKAGGGLTYVRELLCKDPDMAVADLATKVKAKGFVVSTQTLHTTRSGFRQDLRVLQQAGLLKRSLI